MAEVNPTPAVVWSQARRVGHLVRLPGSGNVARLRRPTLTALAATTNGVPNPLSDAVMRLLAAAPPKTEGERMAAFRTNNRGMLEVAALCFVEPVLVLDREPDPEAGEIGPLDLTDLDISWLYFSWVEGDAASVAPFRVAEEPAAP